MMKHNYPRGVHYIPNRNRYKARIVFEKQHYASPSFHTAEEASEWYQAKSLELYGYVHDPVKPNEWKQGGSDES